MKQKVCIIIMSFIALICSNISCILQVQSLSLPNNLGALLKIAKYFSTSKDVVGLT